jgi:hypothetical protein
LSKIIRILGPFSSKSSRLFPCSTHSCLTHSFNCPIGYEFSQGILGTRLLAAQGEYHEWAMFRPERFVAIIFNFLSEVQEMETLGIA